MDSVGLFEMVILHRGRFICPISASLWDRSGKDDFPLPSKIWNTKICTTPSRGNYMEASVRGQGEMEVGKGGQSLDHWERRWGGQETREKKNSLTPVLTGGEQVGNRFAPPLPSVCSLERQSFISGCELFLPVLPSFKGTAKGLPLRCAWHAPTTTCSSLHKSVVLLIHPQGTCWFFIRRDSFTLILLLCFLGLYGDQLVPRAGSWSRLWGSE